MALGAATWVGIGFALLYGLRLATSVVLTRLIHPEVYGLMDLVTVFITGLHLFSDFGLEACVVQSHRGEEPRFLNTAWTIQVVRGVFLTIVAGLLAWPIAWVYERPILTVLVPAVASTALIEGFHSTAVFVLTRQVARRWFVLLEFTNAVVTFLVTLLIVYSIHPALVLAVARGELASLPADLNLVWAVVGGALAGRIVYLAMTHLVLPGARPALQWDPSAAKEIFGFASWIVVSTMLTYLSLQLDRLLVPKLTTFETAGLYGRATGLVFIGTGVITALTAQVVYPVAARLHQEGRHATEFFLPVHTTLATAGALLVTGMLCAGPAAAHLLYPASYDGVGWMLQLLALGAWFYMLDGTFGALLLAMGQRVAMVVPTAAKLVGIVLFVAPGWWLAEHFGATGLVGMIGGFAAAEFLRYLAGVVIAMRQGLYTWHRDLGLSALIVVYAALAHYGGSALAHGVVGDSPSRLAWFWFMLFQGGIAVLLWATTAGVMYRLGMVSLRGAPQVG